MALSVNDNFPDVTFKYIPYTPETADITACGIPINLKPLEEFKGKKFVIVAVPGAFTPTCSANHLPPYVQEAQKFQAKGVERIIFISANDPFVLSAWGKANGVTNDFIIFASDPNAEFSKSIGFSVDLTNRGLGVRTARYAIVVDENGKVAYIEKEPGTDVSVSGADAVLAKL
ncbi:hypothetical protein CANCADRAFT_22906 [Tortispora caseinolytica NRRL Y-17796]|uniref:Thioredoxin peroxidase n=1 Tax=Tortispora caseinolytica NRRL Y-17796 TaxID=767744 RepID=A0A1E4TJJ2_9ASCO|nr:hypothetical protein CANCADRAFT_22906 [Tortispora caseinolytica NRRL Y-17796]